MPSQPQVGGAVCFPGRTALRQPLIHLSSGACWPGASSATLYCSASAISALTTAFLLAPGLGSQMAMCFLPPLHSAESPLESRHRQRSTISEAGARLSQATTDSDLRRGLGAPCPPPVHLSQDSLPALKCVHSGVLAQDTTPLHELALPSLKHYRCGDAPGPGQPQLPLAGCCARAGAQFPVGSAFRCGGTWSERHACSQGLRNTVRGFQHWKD